MKTITMFAINVPLIRGMAFAAGAALFSASCAAGGDAQALRLCISAGGMYAQGRFSETAALLEGIKNFFPALVLRGKALYFSGEAEKAELSFRQAVRRRPSAFEAKLYLTRIVRDRGELLQAEKMAEDLLADNPQDIRALRLAAAIAGELGKTAETLILLDQAADFSAENAMIFLDRARLRWIACRGAEALEDLGRARAMLPRDTPLEKSIEHLESAIRGREMPR